MTATLEGGEWSAARPGCTLSPGKNPVPILQETGWAPGPVWTGGKSRPHRDSIPDPPARSQSLYRLSYPAHSNAILEQYNHSLFHHHTSNCHNWFTNQNLSPNICLQDVLDISVTSTLHYCFIAVLGFTSRKSHTCALATRISAINTYNQQKAQKYVRKNTRELRSIRVLTAAVCSSHLWFRA
jgi:hypothetical protein